ncbi:helix-turn-helix domain-containing protein [Mucilaginibacter sp.]|uniref:helix-turn-helix domain-containing protein n=1 Tax=Mucilaginibacter sp. TaxID=1882438 RepID=UPI00284C32A2|nr:helix-turn-helix domain-containing protein [Mucilaginibacter sp.]MDR3697921.1 helix-turn-helix domain-containing protein [Mucilaginibacter sp.]
MTLQELELLIQEGEGYNVEYKQSFPSKLSELATELCAFANANGGVLMVGVDDKQQVVGITMDNTQRSRIQGVINLIDPALPIKVSEQKVNGKVILCFECPAGVQKPYAVSGSIYVRNGPNSERVTGIEQMRRFFQHSDSIFFDTAPCPSFNYPDDFDANSFQEFTGKAGITAKFAEINLLTNLRLTANNQQLTNAAVLFFAKNVQSHISHATIRCVLFKGIDKRYILDSKEIAGNLVVQYEEALKYLISKLNLRYEIENQKGGPRKEILEIPETVFREALVNALCHRSYYEKGAVIMVEVYDDRVEISNPGGLISSITQQEFGTKSFSRNPLIFGLMQRINLVEKVGSGISRMRDAMKESELIEPKFEMGGFFTVIFYRPMVFEKWLEGWSLHLTTPLTKILLAIHDSERVTKAQLSDIIGQGKTSVDNNISKLRSFGILIREGSDKSGKWVINQLPPPAA